MLYRRLDRTDATPVAKSLRTFVIATCLLLLFNASTIAEKPQIDRLDQSAGGQLGTTFEVRIEGRQLADVKDILLFRNGLELVEIVHDGDESLTLILKAAKDCEPGEHPFALVAERAVSGLRCVQVGMFPVIQEKEPNTTSVTAQAISLPATVAGVVEEGDRDWFRLELKAGQQLTAEAVAMPLGRYLFDASIEIYDTAGNPLAMSDDTPHTKQDPCVSFVAPKDGDYLVLIRESAFGGDLDSNYRLHLGDYPRPSVAYPAGIPTNQPTTVTLLGDPRGPLERSLNVTASDTTVPVAVSPDHTYPGSVLLRGGRYPNLMEVEPNDQTSSATISNFGWQCAMNGILSHKGDVDWFSFLATSGQPLEISVFASRIGSPVDSVLTILDRSGAVVTQNDDGIIHDSFVRFVPPSTGKYFLGIKDQLGRGNPTSVYRVEFRPIEPKFSLRISNPDESMPDQLPALIVPRGSSVPLLVSCRRENCQDALQLFAEQLPEGVALKPSVIESNSHMGVGLFSATDEAPVGARLIRLRAKGLNENRELTGTLSQNVGLVYGQPRKTIYHSIELQQFPILITDRAPIKIVVSPPTSPLVQQGRLDLDVAIQRDPGFEGEVSLHLLNSPPWIRGPEKEVVIGADEDSGTFSLFADAEADERHRKFLLVGVTDDRGDSLILAADPIEVEIAKPLVEVKIEKAVAQMGSNTHVQCRLNWHSSKWLTGKAILRGLPKGCATSPQLITSGQPNFEFPVEITHDAIPAVHNTLYVELSLAERERDAQPAIHFLGHGGNLEILTPGQQPRQEISRLEFLRQKKKSK